MQFELKEHLENAGEITSHKTKDHQYFAIRALIYLNISFQKLNW
jgi:hypothetical protein